MNKCKRSWCFNLSLLVLSCCFQSVYAANAFEAESPWMLGDWNSQRSALQQKGYDFSFGYTGEMATLLDAHILQVMVPNMQTSLHSVRTSI